MQLWFYFQLIAWILTQAATSHSEDCELKPGTLNPECTYQVNETWTHNGTNLTIEGKGALINCTGSAGLLLENFSQVYISQVTIKHCGVNARDHRAAAVTIANSTEVWLDKVQILNSSGTGLSVLSCTQNLTIQSSTFSHNMMAKQYEDGGGGVYINQYNCNAGGHFYISHSNFTNNVASVNIHVNKPNTKNYYYFGTGGGLSVNLANVTDSHVEIEYGHFEHNFAERGGGLHLGFEKECFNNTITISHSHFRDNQCFTKQKIQEGYNSAGGGLSYRDNFRNRGNVVSVQHSCIENNSAYYGGGISAGVNAAPFTQMHQKMGYDQFTVENSSISKNTARIGSAIDLYCAGEINSVCFLEPELMDVSISNNSGIYYRNRDENTYSTVHLEKITGHISGRHNDITQNQASGIGLNDAVLIVNPDSTVNIAENTAVVGGGIVAIGMSVVILKPKSNLSITGNTVANKGGGIFSAQTMNTYSIYTYSCFIKYSENSHSPTTHPNKWSASVTIKGNRADNKLSSIFASSIYPCVWPTNATTNDITRDILQTFCGWKSWNMDSDCTDHIQTLPQNFTSTEYNVTLYPMNETSIEGFEVMDDLNHTVTNTTLFSICISETHNENKCKTQSDGKVYISNGNLRMEAGEPREQSLLVQTTGFRSIGTRLNAFMNKCPVGYSVSQSNGMCECNIKENPITTCTNDSFLILDILLGHCIGRNNNNVMVIAKCPYTINLETFRDPFVHVFIPRDDPNEEFCASYNRTGVLCSQCRPNEGINVFSPVFTCIKCNHTIRDITGSLAAVLLPQSAFIILVIVFHVGITSPSMNAYIFFSHVSLLPIQVLLIKIGWKLSLMKDPHTNDPTDHHIAKLADHLTKVALDPYRLWTFDYPEMFGLHSCFGQNFKIMHSLAFQYLPAFFPMVLVLVVLIFIELHARNCKPVVHMWKPFCYLCIRLRRTWELRTSIIDAFATVVLLSYSKVVNTSISLLRRNLVKKLENDTSKEVLDVLLDFDTATQYFKGNHTYFGLAAIFILCTFGLIPPLLLTLYPYKWFKRVLGWGKLDKWHGLYAFVETFQGCYKDGTNNSRDRRWFAGMYFIFRIIIFLEYALIDDLSSMFAKLTFTYIMFLLLFITVRPYKKDYYNYLDGIFLIILISVNLFIYYLISYAQQQKTIYKPFFYLAYTLLLLPTIYLLLFTLYLICTRSKWLKKHCLSRFRECHQRSYRFLAETRLRGSLFQEDTFSVLGGELVPSTSPLDNLSEVPDRIDHPDRYGDFDQSTTRSATYYKAGYTKVNSEGREKRL